MPILSRRTLAALALSSGLFGVLGFAMPGRAAEDNTNVVQALHAGGIVIVVRHGATFPDQADTDPLNFDNIAAQRNLNEKAKRWQRPSATPSGRPEFRSARSIPAIRDRGDCGLQEYREDHKYYRGRARGIAE